jgi:ABC-2 type transport system ATP-binding protein
VDRPMISVEGVRFRYRSDDSASRVLECDRLELGPGLTLLVGPNGAGKSTLLKLLAGIERPLTGTVAIGGHDLWRDEVRARRELAYVPEHPDLSPYATVGAVLRLVAQLRGVPAGAAEDALTRVGLSGLGRRSVRELSMGQRRRAVLAAAFIGTPNVLLLDEPLEAMDAEMRGSLVSWLREVTAAGRTVLAATHLREPFTSFTARILPVREGRVGVPEPFSESR